MRRAVRFLHLKMRFGMSKLPLLPVTYRLRTSGFPDLRFRWTRVMPFLDPDHGAFRFELWGWDVRELRFLRRFLGLGMKFIDVGAHEGLYSVLAGRLVGSEGRVLAIEPAPCARRRLRAHLRRNGIANADVVECAVAAQAGRARLFVPITGVDTTARLGAPFIGSTRVRPVFVETRRLDEIVEDSRLRPDVIKVDVEGAEGAVLDGARGILATCRPFWIVETLDVTSAAWGSSGRALVDRLTAEGHALYEFLADGRLQPHEPRAAYPLDSNCNLLAVPVEKVSAIRRLCAEP